MNLILVADAQPNFIKIASMCEVLNQKKDVDYCLVHIGQNYEDILLSDSIIRSIFNPSFVKKDNQ